MLKGQKHNVSYEMVHRPVGADALLEIPQSRGLTGGFAIRVLWPSFDYYNYINEGWEGCSYFKYIPSLGTYETFVILED